MEQLGLLDEIKQVSKPLGKITVLRDDLSVIPKERIHLGKRFVNSQNIIDPVTRICHLVQVRCSDGSLYLADVLVGADGASSAVRQSLFRRIKEEHGNGIGGHGHGRKPLPKQDQEEQRYKQVALVGVTGPLNLKRYPDLGETFSQFKVVLNRQSPYMLISKVMLEERVFKTWYGGRTVLLGDECTVHGQGRKRINAGRSGSRITTARQHAPINHRQLNCTFNNHRNIFTSTTHSTFNIYQ
ncbi:hypothetical protein BGZ90_006788 [Linnemannia elongata]|nr:hypothetical protein BGZ90_006788 [Linnemannia elongata]